jgi:hypothetical protein
LAADGGALQSDRMTVLTRNLAKDGSFAPAAVNVLGQIPEGFIFHLPHGLRHPESTYALSLKKVGTAFLRVARGWEAALKGLVEGQPFDLTSLLEDQEHLLSAAQEHIGDCWLVLKALVNPHSSASTQLFAEEYVLANKLPGAKAFKDAVQPYRRALLANKIRHQLGRLRGVVIWLPGEARVGYYLEEPDAAGHLGPSRAVHPDGGAISFARDLGWHLFNIYLCSDRLATAVDRALMGLHGCKITRAATTGDRRWAEIAVFATRMPQAVFPKEKQVAVFELDGAAQTLRARFPVAASGKFPPTIKVSVATVGDGHSRTFKMPVP